MRNLEEEPHSGSAMLWLMAVLVIVLSTKVETVLRTVLRSLGGCSLRLRTAHRAVRLTAQQG
jgi:hypothetical protein